jgi:hypothetical protein
MVEAQPIGGSPGWRENELQRASAPNSARKLGTKSGGA